MILLVCESRKLRDSKASKYIAFFLLARLVRLARLARLVRLARLALIFSREASNIFHKILARKIAKRDSLSTLVQIRVRIKIGALVSHFILCFNIKITGFITHGCADSRIALRCSNFWCLKGIVQRILRGVETMLI
jgi:hypothetical protein